MTAKPERLILFTSLPKVGGHTTITLGLCRLLRPHFRELEVWCKTMPDHGFSAPAWEELKAMGCHMELLADGRGRLDKGKLLMLVVRALRYPTASFFTIAMGHLSFVMALLLARQQSLYYHITHDLNARTIRRLSTLCRVFKKLVFISPATYREFSSKTGRRDGLSWTAQISELPPIDAKLLLAERLAKLAGNPAIRFGLIGRLTEHKGAGEILRFIDGTAANCEFHVAGSGPFGNEFQRRHRERQAGSNVKVHFYGAYEPTERVEFLRTFFSNVDWLIVPTLDEWETLSMALLEGLQHGVPCIATRTGGLKSFEMPELGPAPQDVVRLVEPSEMGKVVDELALTPRPTTQIATACLDYYAAFFSNKAVGKRWLELAGCPSERPVGSE